MFMRPAVRGRAAHPPPGEPFRYGLDRVRQGIGAGKARREQAPFGTDSRGVPLRQFSVKYFVPDGTY